MVADFSDKMSQISNVKIQREHPEYENLSADSVQNFKNFRAYLLQSFSPEQVHDLFERMKELALNAIKALKARTLHEGQKFEYG